MKRRLTEAVAAVEATSGLEVVVRVAPRSGSYRDVAWSGGAALGFALLAAATYLPVQVSDLWLVPNVLLAGAVGAWLTSRLPVVVRLLTRTARRDAQVLEAARACFVSHAVSATGDRTGVLVYASNLEGRVVVLPDFGAEAAAPDAEWAAVRRLGQREGALPDRVLAVLAGLVPLGERFVTRRADDTNELPDEPSIG